MSNTALDFFDLDEVAMDEREEFMEEVGALVMKAVLRKAWIELDTVKRDTLSTLLEESTLHPDDEKKYEAVLIFLDENVEKVREYAKNEVEQILRAYSESKDAVDNGTE